MCPLCVGACFRFYHQYKDYITKCKSLKNKIIIIDYVAIYMHVIKYQPIIILYIDIYLKNSVCGYIST